MKIIFKLSVLGLLLSSASLYAHTGTCNFAIIRNGMPWPAKSAKYSDETPIQIEIEGFTGLARQTIAGDLPLKDSVTLQIQYEDIRTSGLFSTNTPQNEPMLLTLFAGGEHVQIQCWIGK